MGVMEELGGTGAFAAEVDRVLAETATNYNAAPDVIARVLGLAYEHASKVTGASGAQAKAGAARFAERAGVKGA